MKIQLLGALALGFCGVVHAQTNIPTRAVSDLDDVMDGQRPKMPAFPALVPKRGYLRGYAKDVAGKPLVDARILIAAPSLGWSSLTGSAHTDARGYYEIKLPSGGCSVRYAGYGTSYDGKLYALPLHPADSEIDSIPMSGGIENFVLMTYGAVTPAKAANDPSQASAYYGGLLTVGYWANEEGDTGPASNFSQGDLLELTLTPDGLLLDGSRGRAFVIHHTLKSSETYFQINDVPIGRYKIKAAIKGHEGKAIKISEKSGWGGVSGLTPNPATNEADLLLRSAAADNSTIVVMAGGMARHDILIGWKE